MAVTTRCSKSLVQFVTILWCKWIFCSHSYPIRTILSCRFICRRISQWQSCFDYCCVWVYPKEERSYWGLNPPFPISSSVFFPENGCVCSRILPTYSPSMIEIPAYVLLSFTSVFNVATFSEKSVNLDKSGNSEMVRWASRGKGRKLGRLV